MSLFRIIVAEEGARKARSVSLGDHELVYFWPVASSSREEKQIGGQAAKEAVVSTARGPPIVLLPDGHIPRTAASDLRSPEDPAATVCSPAIPPEFRERHMQLLPPIPRPSSLIAQSKRLGSTQEDEKCFQATIPADGRMWAPNEDDDHGSSSTPVHVHDDNQNESCCTAKSVPHHRSSSTSMCTLTDEEEEEDYDCSTPSVLWSGEYKFDRFFSSSWSENQKIDILPPPTPGPSGGREEGLGDNRGDTRHEGDFTSKLGPKARALEEMLPKAHRHVETLPPHLGLATRRCSFTALSSTGSCDCDAMLKNRFSSSNSTITTGSGFELCPCPHHTTRMGPHNHSSCLRWDNHSNIIRNGHHHHHAPSSSFTGSSSEDTDTGGGLFSLSGARDDDGEAMVSEPETDTEDGSGDGGEEEVVNVVVASSKCSKEKQQNSSSNRSASRASRGEEEKQQKAEKTKIAEKARNEKKKKKRTAKAMSSEQEENATTMMVRNIPRRQMRVHLQENLLQSGFHPGVDYDFLYLPIARKIRQNLGYAFINFGTSEKAREFAVKWHKKRLTKGRKARALNVSVALVQGKEENWNLLKSDNKARKVVIPKLQISTSPDVESPEICQVTTYEDPDAGSIEPDSIEPVDDFCVFMH